MSKKKSDVPRFVLSITDTQTTITGEKGEQYMQLSIAADRLSDFTKKIPEEKRKNQGRTEFEAMLLFFSEQVDTSNIGRKRGEKKGYTQVELKDDEDTEAEE